MAKKSKDSSVQPGAVYQLKVTLDGKGGYHDVIMALRNPSRRDNAELLEWLGEYDPEHFDADKVNEQLAKIR